MNNIIRKILIVAGDASGDMHGAALCKAFREAHTGILISALGGDDLARGSDRFLGDLVSLSAFGFLRPALLYFKFRKILNHTILPYIKNEKPHAIVLIDFYGFNIHIARAAHAFNIPVFYFISPQVWATRRNRIFILKEYIRKMFVIFPFEETIYQNAGVPVSFVGHPLLDRLPAPLSNTGMPDHFHIGLLPGSRIHEIHYHLPIMIETARIILKQFPTVRYSLFAPPHTTQEHVTDIRRMINSEPIDIVFDSDYSHRRSLDFAITSSGTASLENALLGIPMIVMYKTSWISYAIARLLIRITRICMVNIVLKKDVVPEFIQHNAEPKKIAQTITNILSRSDLYDNMKRSFKDVSRILGSRGAVKKVARDILHEVTECA